MSEKNESEVKEASTAKKKEVTAKPEKRPFNEGDRVCRRDGSGPHGVVKSLREEVTSSNAKTKAKDLMVKVLWDSGTFSYFSPEVLKAAK